MSNKPEEISSFFNVRANGYDIHTRNSLEFFNTFYETVSKPVLETNESIKILDLGVGTGLELDHIFKKAPNALVSAIDISTEMLNRLKDKFDLLHYKIKIINESYLTYSFDDHAYYDYAVSVMTLHHLEFREKSFIYKKIYNSLKDNGIFIEADYIVSKNDEKQLLSKYKKIINQFNLTNKVLYHIDIPFSIETQTKALEKANFRNIDIIFQTDNSAILVSKK